MDIVCYFDVVTCQRMYGLIKPDNSLIELVENIKYSYDSQYWVTYRYPDQGIFEAFVWQVLMEQIRRWIEDFKLDPQIQVLTCDNHERMLVIFNPKKVKILSTDPLVFSNLVERAVV